MQLIISACAKATKDSSLVTNDVVVSLNFLSSCLLFPVCRLYVATLRQLRCGTGADAVFGMFDGHGDITVPVLVLENIADVLHDQIKQHNVPAKFMKYTFLAMHRYT